MFIISICRSFFIPYTLIILSTSLGCISYINACLKHCPSHYCLVPAWNFIGPVVNFMDSCHSPNASLASEPEKSTFALFMAVFQLLVVAAWQHMKAAHSLWLYSESRWFRTTMKGVLSHTREDTLVMIRAGCIVSELHLVTCLFCSKKTKENSLNPMTCCTFDIISYLS